MRNSLHILLTGMTLVVLAACQRAEQPVAQDGGDFRWARAALERNPQLEIVAADSDSEVFTVRDKQTGEVLALKLDEIVAAPVSRLSAPVPATAATPEASESPAAPPAPAGAPPATAQVASGERTEQAAAQQTSPSSQPTDAPSYTIERADGQLRVTGPGVSIVSSGSAPAGSSAPNAERATDPIICEGRRMLQLDSRDIYVEGDAITARGGCELYITNSRVIGSNVGVVVQDAVVHIANSYVEGASASFLAGNDAKVYLRSSTFQGVPRRAEDAVVQDQGGNRWR